MGVTLNLTNNVSTFAQGNTRSPYKDVDSACTEALWYRILSSTAAVLTLLGNCLVIYLIGTRRRLHFATNFFILSLAVADLCVGAFVIPTSLLLHPPSTLLLRFYNAVLYVEVGNMFVMTWDRFKAVTRPLNYRSWMTTARFSTMILLAWFVPGIISLCPLFWMFSSFNESQKQTYWRIFNSFSLIVFELTPCIAMLLIYCRIFAIARKHSKQISIQLEVSKCSSAETKSSNRRKVEKSSVKAIGLVVLFFIFCYTLSAYRMMCENWRFCSISTLTIQISRLFLFWNSALNFCVYALLKTDIRRELLKCLTISQMHNVRLKICSKGVGGHKH